MIAALPALAGACALVAALAAPAPPATSAGTLESWYTVSVGEVPAGWMVQRELERDGRRLTETVLRLGFRRGDEVQSIGLETRFVETPDGRPLAAESRQELGQTPVEARYEYRADGVVATYRQGDGERVETVSLPERPWLTPGQASARLREALAAGRERFSMWTVDPQMGVQPFEVVYERIGDVELEALGERRAAVRYRQTQSLAPTLASTVDLAADGTVLRSETPLLGSTMTTVLVDRERALSSAGNPELLVRSFVTPSRPLAEPRQLRRAVYELSLEGGGGLPRPAETGDQRVELLGTTRARVTVELGSSPRVPLPVAEREATLATSTWIDPRDPGVALLAKRALAGVPRDEATRAEALRAFVGAHLEKKDLGTVLATSAEVAAGRSGDCTEHAVLLGAMLRAAGIPSRVVTGLVYAERFAGASGIFAYHMWTQGYVDGRWLDLDATLERRFDAAHVALSVSPFGDDESALLEIGRITPLLGRLEIAVVEASP